jgi:hypothetical protein
MKVVKPKEIEDVSLESVPSFYQSMGGSKPYQDRLDRGIDTRQNLFKIAKRIDIEGETEFDGFISTFNRTVRHNLGFLPYPEAQMILGGDNFPFPFPGEPGFEATATFSDITTDIISVQFVTIGLTESVDIFIRIYLLRETIT